MLPKNFVFSAFFFGLSLPCLLASCAPSYDRYMQEGNSLLAKNENEKAKLCFRNAAREAGKSKDSVSRRIAALTAEAEAAQKLSPGGESAGLLKEACSLAESSGAFQQAAELKCRLAALFSAASLTAEAESYYQEALSSLHKAGLDKSHAAANVLIALGDLKGSSGDYNEAARLVRKACAMMEEINDDMHARSLAYYKLSFIYQQLNMENEAQEAGEKAKGLEISGIRGSIDKLPKF